MAKRKCRSCGSFTECNDIRLCPSCVDDICPTADPRIEMHCEHSVHVRERIAELDAKANELERERDEARKRVAELERGRCEDCGATLTLDGCVLCGAPVCCPQCCRLQSLADHIEKLQAAVKELEARIATLRNALCHYAAAPTFSLSVAGRGAPQDGLYTMLHIGPDIAQDALERTDKDGA